MKFLINTLLAVCAFSIVSCATTKKIYAPFYADGLNAGDRAKSAIVKVSGAGSTAGYIDPEIRKVGSQYTMRAGYTNSEIVMKPGQQTLHLYTMVRSAHTSNFIKEHSLTFNFKGGHTYTVSPDAGPKDSVWFLRIAPNMNIFDNTTGVQVYPITPRKQAKKYFGLF